MKCIGCKFAEWSRTKTGALHPNGTGKCTWRLVIKVPGSFNTYGFKVEKGDQIEFRGGYIDRRDSRPKGCEVREEQ